MPKLLIINGHDTYESSPGHLNQTMVEVMREELKDKFEIQISVLKDGYETEEERRKFLEADVIIYQMPVFWFAAPALLKKYMEDGVFTVYPNSFVYVERTLENGSVREAVGI